MIKVLAIVTDLFFREKIRATTLGYSDGASFRSARSLEQIQEAAADGYFSDASSVVIFVDLHLKGEDPLSLAKILMSEYGLTQIVAFYAHVERERGESASICGFSKVLTRSKLIIELPKILKSVGDGSFISDTAKGANHAHGTTQLNDQKQTVNGNQS